MDKDFLCRLRGPKGRMETKKEERERSREGGRLGIIEETILINDHCK